MKKLLIVAILIASGTANAQQICQKMSDGTVICTPAGGGKSSYR